MPQPFVAVHPDGLDGANVLSGPPRDSAAPASPQIAQPLPRRRGIEDLGPLTPYLSDGLATDAFVNGERGLWIDRGHGLELESSWRADERMLRDLATRLIALGGRHIDEATPCVDVRLHDGMRVHAVLPPISTIGTLISVRLPRIDGMSLADLESAGMFDAGGAAKLRRAVQERSNILITGAAGSGKTTLLAALLADAPTNERIVAIEDVAELRVDHPHFVSLESRQANLEGAGEIGLQRLVREALRMRPDRLVLGECRGAEVRELLAVLNTGHDGGAGTLHANSLRDVPTRLEALGALAGMSPSAIARQTVSAIGLVVHLGRRRGQRRLEQMGTFALTENDRLGVVPAPGAAVPAPDAPDPDPDAPVPHSAAIRDVQRDRPVGEARTNRE